MKEEIWGSIDQFLMENDLAFTHAETEDDFKNELKRLQDEREKVVGILMGERKNDRECRNWKPVKRRVTRWVDGGFKVVTITTYVCAD